MSDKTGGSVFPLEEKHADGTHYHTHPGMTLRDYFAAQAMQGELSAQNEDSQWHDADKLASWAYRIADAMLAERSKP